MKAASPVKLAERMGNQKSSRPQQSLVDERDNKQGEGKEEEEKKEEKECLINQLSKKTRKPSKPTPAPKSGRPAEQQQPVESSSLLQPSLPIAYQLDVIQRNQVQKLWRLARASRGASFPGNIIFAKLFSQCPEAKTVFSDRVRMKFDADFHSTKFSEVLDELIQGLANLADFSNNLLAIGRHHVQYRSSNFKPEMWDDLAEAIIHCSIHWGHRNQRNAATQEGWTKIVMFLTEKVKRGYYEEVLLKRCFIFVYYDDSVVQLRKMSHHRASQSATKLSPQVLPVLKESPSRVMSSLQLNVDESQSQIA